MRTIGGILSLVVVMVIAYYLYYTRLSDVGGGMPPMQQIDLVGVRSNLISIAQSERIFLATNGTYGTLEQLQRSGGGSPAGIRRSGYVYEAEVDGAHHFRIVARPEEPSGPERPTLSIDETMQISSDAPSSQSFPGGK